MNQPRGTDLEGTCGVLGIAISMKELLARHVNEFVKLKFRRKVTVLVTTPVYYQHKQYSPNKLSTKDFSRTLFREYAKFITKPVVKGLVIVMALAVTGVATWGNILLEQKFDVTWFLPPGNSQIHYRP